MNQKQYQNAVKRAIDDGKYQTLRKLLDSDAGKKYGVGFMYSFYVPMNNKIPKTYIDYDGKRRKVRKPKYYGTPLFHATLLEMERHSRIKTVSLLLEKGANTAVECYHYKYVPAYLFFECYNDPDELVYTYCFWNNLDKLVFDKEEYLVSGAGRPRVKRLIKIFAPYTGHIPFLD